MSWPAIDELIKDATARGDPVAKHIKSLKLETNHISLYLTDPYVEREDSNEEIDSEDDDEKECLPSAIIDIDLDLSAFANARRLNCFNIRFDIILSLVLDITIRNVMQQRNNKKP